MRKTILCAKISKQNKIGLQELAEMKNRSVSSIVNTTITDLLKFHKIEVDTNEDTK